MCKKILLLSNVFYVCHRGIIASSVAELHDSGEIVPLVPGVKRERERFTKNEN